MTSTEGGRPRRLTAAPSDDGNGTWSRDGRFIYFGSNRGGSSEIWKMPAAGGSAVQVSRGGGVCAEESDDGQYVYYSKAKCSSGIWRMPLSGGDESEVLKEPVGWGNWALGRRGVLYVTCRAQGSRQECTIQFLDSATGRTKPLFRTADFDHVWNPATSPDEKWILFSASPPLHSELMLMENFR